VDSVNYSFPNLAVAGEALLQLSSVHDGLMLNAVLEAVASHENVSIISRPKVAVREGGRAEIVNISQIPFYNVSSINSVGNYGATLEYKDVGIKLYVIPRVVGTDTIDLNIDIEASQQSGTSVSFASGDGGIVLSNPVLTQRSAKTTVYLEPGQAVILGGLISERTVESEKKVPVLGDIPIIGNFFKSRLNRKEQTNVLFFIRPRILHGSDLRRSFD
jgi:general secretion pathway protein D